MDFSGKYMGLELEYLKSKHDFVEKKEDIIEGMNLFSYLYRKRDFVIKFYNFTVYIFSDSNSSKRASIHVLLHIHKIIKALNTNGSISICKLSAFIFAS